MRLKISLVAVAGVASLPMLAAALKVPEQVTNLFRAPASPATAQACDGLQKLLGPEKVVTGRYDLSYLFSLSLYA